MSDTAVRRRVPYNYPAEDYVDMVACGQLRGKHIAPF